MAKDILIVPGSSNIHFSGSAVNDIKLETQDSGSVAFTSNSGSILTLTNSFTGSLFSVGDVSGVPILDVNSDDTVTLGQFSSPLKVFTNASSHTIISGSSTSTGSFGRLQATTIAGNSPLNIESPNLTGNVGIGATSPATELQIGDYTDAAETITIATSNEGTGRINFYDNNATEGGSIRVVGASLGSKMHFANRWNVDVDRVTFDLITGKVGIGTASPSSTLHVKSTSADGYIIAESSHAASSGILEARSVANRDSYVMFREGTSVKAQIFNDSSNDALVLTDGSNSNVMHIKGGKIGIGTVSPATNFHIHNASSYAHMQLSRPTDTTTIGFIGFKNNTGNNIAMIEGFSHNATAGKLIMGVNGTANAITVETSGNVTMPKNLTVLGSLTAQEFITELNTTTIIATSGSTKFGNTSDDTHQMTGSLKVSGSLTLQNGFSLTPTTSNYAQLGGWLNVGTIGLFSGTNGAHIYPNTASDYGAWRINGSKGGWGGITFEVGGVYNTLMSNASTMGFYNDTDNEWMISANRNTDVKLYYNGVQKLATSSTGATVSGNLRLDGGGNASDPLLTTLSDTNTGIYFPGSGKTGVGGTGGLVVENGGTFGGNVGIGTASPAQKFHVYGASDTFHRTDAGASSGIQYQLWHGGTQTATINSNTTNIFSIHDGAFGGTNVFNIKDGGNVGIGDATPTEGKLVVAGTGAYNTPPLHISMTDSSEWNHFVNMVDSNLTAGENGIIVFGQELDSKNAAWIGYKHRSDHGNDNQLTLGFWGANNLVNILPTGRMGIGTETPSQALHVVGNIAVGTGGIKLLTNGQLLEFGDGNVHIDRAGNSMNLHAYAGHIFSINGSTAMTIDNSGHLGIGATPSNLLQVGSHVHVTSAGLVGIGLAAPETDLHISNTSPAVRFTDENVSNLKHQIIGGGDAGLEYSADFNNVAAGYHRWDISGAEKMRLIESGDLGIGTSVPLNWLHMAQSTGGSHFNEGIRIVRGEFAGNATQYSIINNYNGTLNLINRGGSNHGYFNFYSTADGSNLKTMLHIDAREDQYITPTGSAISYNVKGAGVASLSNSNTQMTVSGSYVIYQDLQEKTVVHSGNDDYQLMKTFTPSKGGRVTLQFEAYITSGTYYWAFRIGRNGDGRNDSNTGAYQSYDTHFQALHNKPFSGYLDPSNASSVHAYRKYNLNIRNLRAGETVDLYMVSSTSGGTPQTGNGQTLYLKNFKVLNDAPSAEINPIHSLGKYVGIGITTPSSELTVKSTHNDHHQVFEVLDYSGDGLFNIRQSANDALLRAYADGGVQKVQIHTGGVSYFTGGNVGIGNTSPPKALTVAGEISSSLSGNNNSTFRSTSGGARIILDSTTNETTTGIRFAEAGAIEGSIIYDHSDDSLDFRTGGADATRMTIDNAGNVGINNTDPQGRLHIDGATNGINFGQMASWNRSFMGMNVKASSTNGRLTRIASSTTDYPVAIAFGYQDVAGFGSEDSKGGINFITVGSNLSGDIDPDTYSRMYIHKGGNIGINDTTPSYKLDVNGNGRFTGKLFLNAAEALETGGIRGQAFGDQTGDFIQLYERVNIGYPGGWGAAAASAPAQGLSVYGSVQVGRNGSGVLQMNGTTVIDASRNITNAGTYNGINISTLNTSAVKTTGVQTIAGSKTFSGIINSNSHLIMADGFSIKGGSGQEQIINMSGTTVNIAGEGNATTVGGNLTVAGTITAQQFITEYTTDTVIATSGSTNFGNSSDDRHDFSGSLAVSGSGGLTVTSAPSNNHLKLVSAGTGGNVAIRFDVEKTATNYVDWQIGAQGIAANAFTIGHSTGNGNLTFNAANTDLTILSSGNVGIGTTSPGSKLEIWQGVGNGSSYDVIKIDGNTGNYGGMWIAGQWANSQQGRIGFWGSSTAAGTRGVALIGDGGTTPHVFLNSGGQLGLNTTSPVDNFHVMGASAEGAVGSTHADSIALFQNNVNASDQCFITIVGGTTGGAGIHFGDKDDSDAGVLKYDLYTAGGGGFEFWAEGSERMSILANGNVGIGTTNPGRKFVVSTGSDTYAQIETTSATNDAWLRFHNVGDNNEALNYRIGRTHDGRLDFGLGNGTHLMSLISTGLGIHTHQPSFPLSVGSNTNEARVEIGTSGQTTWQSNVYSVLTVGVSGSHAITQDGSGNSQQWFNVYDTGNKYRAHAGYGANWMYNVSTGTLAFRNTDTTSTAGSQITDLTPKFSIDKIGKVGIGTDTPVEAITIRGTSSGTDGFHYPAIAGYTTTTKLWALEQHFGNEGRLGLYYDGNLKVLMRASGSSYINSGATMNFGVGTASPSYKLHVVGSAFAKNLTLSGWSSGDALTLNYGNATGTVEAVTFRSNGGVSGNIKNVLVSANSGDLILNSSTNTNQLTLYRDGNVGIGDTTPTYKLDVAGTGRFVGDVTIGTGSDSRLKFVSGTSRAHIGPDQNVELRFGYANASDKNFYHNTTNVAKINGSGITVPSGNISGSSVSTGSFGRIDLHQGLYFNREAAGNAIFEGRAHYQSPFVKFDAYNRGRIAFGADVSSQAFFLLDGEMTHTWTGAELYGVHINTKMWPNVSRDGVVLRVQGEIEKNSNAGVHNWFKGTDFRAPTVGNATATVTNTATVHIDGAMTVGTTNNYSLYNASTADSYFNGNVGIGSTNPYSALNVRGANGANGNAKRLVAFFDTTSAAAGTGAGISLGGYTNGTGGDINDFANIQGIKENGTAGNYASALTFQTRANGAGTQEQLRISSAGNVGIGTTSPGSTLHVHKASGPTYLRISDEAAANGLEFGYENGGFTNASIYNRYSSNAASAISFGFGTPSSGNVVATMLQSGNVGIGTNSPDTDFHLERTSNCTMQVEAGGSNQTSLILRSGGLRTNTDTSRIWFQGGSNTQALIEAQSGGSSAIGSLAFHTNDGTSLTERMRISSVGDVGIGVAPNANFKTYIYDNTSDANAWVMNVYQDGAAGNGVRIDVDSTDTTDFILQCGANGGSTEVLNVMADGQVGIMDTTPSYPLDVTGTIRATSDVIAYSDERVKDNIETIENPLDKIKELRGVSYNRNDIEDKSKKIGVIAQEVEKILPEVVEQDDEGKYSVAYGNMVGLLIESVKEQQKQIEELKSEIQELKDGSSK